MLVALCVLTICTNKFGPTFNVALRVNGSWACQNDHLLNDDLKGTMGFEGFVVSDWYATHSTDDAANNGLDMEVFIFSCAL